MSAALKLQTVDTDIGELPPSPEPKCVTTAKALWTRLGGLCDREQATLSVCLETSMFGRGRRRRPTQERVVIAFRSNGRLRVFDPCSNAGPLRELTCAQDLACYFDETAGFSYVVVR